MKSFLRKFRLEYSHKKSIKKYLLYALGEIILVVIGILIALQINNWNIESQNKAELNSILGIVKIDLETDTSQINRTISFHENRLIKMDSILNKQFDLKSFEECQTCPYFLANFRSISVSNKGADKLNKAKMDIATKKDSLYYDIVSFYTDVEDSNDIYNELLKTQFLENINKLKNEKEWFSDWLNSKRNNEIDDYFLNDPIYRNRLNLFSTVIKTNYLPFLEEYKTEAENLLNRIEKKLD